MRRSPSWYRQLIPALPSVVLGLACGSDSGGPSTPADISGAFATQAAITNAPLGVSCSARGTIAITQTGGAFTGTFDQTGSCTGPGGTINNSGADLITNGIVNGAKVSFNTPGCQWNGTAQGDPPEGASGTVSCNVNVGGGQTIPLSGTWQAGRGAASVTVNPATLLLDETDSLVLAGDVLDAAGQPLTRQLDWVSDDPAVATVGTDGKVRAVGRGSTTIRVTTVPVGSLEFAQSDTIDTRVTILFIAIDAGSRHDCGVARSGAAYCWGKNSYGQLGDGTTTDSPVPVKVSGGHSFVSVTTSSGLFDQQGLPGLGDHTCAVELGGQAWCWGSNDAGQLGDGSTTQRHEPVAVSGGLSFRDLSTGMKRTCGVTTVNAGYCWGSAYLGDGTNGGSSTPVPVTGGVAFALLSVSGDFNINFTCGVSTSNLAFCWGDNINGQLGTGTSPTNSVPAPGAVSGGLSFAAANAGALHSCGFTTTGAGYCWGFNSSGRLGNGSAGGGDPPVAVSGGLSFSRITAGREHSCGITTQGQAYCWGEGGYGQLGNGGQSSANEPTAVSATLQFSEISAGDDHTCAITTAGEAYCWGITSFGMETSPFPVVP